MAPEVWGLGVYVHGLAGQKAPYDTSKDVYSFGMTCYEVITGLRPFDEYLRNDELQRALAKEERPELPPGMSCPKSLEELMSRCWAQKPSDRPDFKEVEKALWTIKYQLELQ
jgi:serine/threonine protein kinase